MIKKFIISSVLMLCFGTVAFAQGTSRALPFLELNPDIRSAGMGDASMGQTKGMFLYNNPAAFFNIDKNIYGSYTYTLYPKISLGSNMYHALSGGYKLNNRHAFFIGARYIGGLKINRRDENGIETKPIRPMDWSVDFGYSLRTSDNFAIFISGNVIQSYNSKVAISGGVSFGACYNNYIKDKYHYSLNVDFRDLGSKVKYGKSGAEYDMPSSFAFGGSIGFPISSKHQINTSLMCRNYYLPSESADFTTGLGLEYGFNDLIFVRGGYHIGNSNNYATAGIGCKYKFISLDVAYVLATQKEFNLLRVGINVIL